MAPQLGVEHEMSRLNKLLMKELRASDLRDLVFMSDVGELYVTRGSGLLSTSESKGCNAAVDPLQRPGRRVRALGMHVGHASILPCVSISQEAPVLPFGKQRICSRKSRFRVRPAGRLDDFSPTVVLRPSGLSRRKLLIS